MFIAAGAYRRMPSEAGAPEGFLLRRGFQKGASRRVACEWFLQMGASRELPEGSSLEAVACRQFYKVDLDLPGL